MLELIVPENEIYDAAKNQFITIPSCVITLEHSLISLAKWESKWHTPYLNNSQKRTMAQELDYIRCMHVGPVKNTHVFKALTPENIQCIKNYIDDPMTAATFPKSKSKPSREVVTAEILYCRMFANNIPMECQKWHLNRLLALIRACDIKNGPVQKMSKRETAMRNAELNAARRAKLNTRG